jgi:hypothetical protein
MKLNPVCFTLDAANVHVLYPENEAKNAIIKNELVGFVKMGSTFVTNWKWCAVELIG